MPEIKLICVGKLKEAYWRDAVQEYAKRLSAFCRFAVAELPEARLPQNPGEAEILRALDAEGKAIEDAAGRSTVFSLCIEGRPTSSEQLAAAMAREMVGGAGSLAFVIGSSHGLSERVKALGHRVSMSPMTFPHQLARVMLCEQLYRAFAINAGTKYHK